MNERPFLPELAWAYFSAFQTVLMANFIVFKCLQNGNADLLSLNRDYPKKILKVTLPERSEWIDSNKPEHYHYLIDELEEKLLFELKKILDGAEDDYSTTDRAISILKTVNAGSIENQGLTVSLTQE
jgi:hypothetical protein